MTSVAKMLCPVRRHLRDRQLAPSPQPATVPAPRPDHLDDEEQEHHSVGEPDRVISGSPRRGDQLDVENGAGKHILDPELPVDRRRNRSTCSHYRSGGESEGFPSTVGPLTADGPGRRRVETRSPGGRSGTASPQSEGPRTRRLQARDCLLRRSQRADHNLRAHRPQRHRVLLRLRIAGGNRDHQSQRTADRAPRPRTARPGRVIVHEARREAGHASSRHRQRNPEAGGGGRPEQSLIRRNEPRPQRPGAHPDLRPRHIASPAYQFGRQCRRHG